MAVSDCEGTFARARILQPRIKTAVRLENQKKIFKSEGMRIVASEKMLETMNKLTKLHSNPDSGCDNVEFMNLKETKVGSAWKHNFQAQEL